MRFQKILLASLSVMALSATSCSNDDSPTELSVPVSYSFERNATTTVDFSGQKSRLLMLEEMGAYIKDNASIGVNDTKLVAMYSNTGNPFSSAVLNASGKQLFDKTASSTDYFSLNLGGGSSAEQQAVRNVFSATFVDAKNASQGAAAAAGVAGSYTDGTSKRLFAANGLEPQQVLLKGMMGASFMDQIVNNYLSVNKLDAGTTKVDNSNKIVVSGKNYTEMEHNWDEAYGYIYGADDLTIADNKGLKFWSSYIVQVNADADFNTVSADINLAFRKGRAAITANDYATRDAQINIIKTKLALIPAVRAVFYLQEGKGKLTVDSGAKGFHALSEAYGFIMSLRYTNKPGTNNPYFSKAEVDGMLTSLTNGANGLWDINTLPAKCDAISAQIATKFGFTVAQAATVN